MTAAPAAQTARATLREWFGLAVLVVPVLMTAMDMTVLFLATPHIGAALSPSGTQQLWVLHVGDLVGAGLVLTVGRAIDRFGPRRLLAAGLIFYAAASLLAANAPTVELLIGARVLLGAAAVTATPAAMTLARRMFVDEKQFATAVAILMASFSAGMALGPLVGGILLDQFWWGAVFLINVPVAVLVLLALRVVPRVDGTGTGGIDVLSVLLSLGGMAGTVYGGQELGAGSATPAVDTAILVAGIAMLGLFVRRQLRLPVPLLDLRLFRSPPVTLALLAILVVIVADSPAELQLAQHLQIITGLSPLQAGLALAVPAVVSVAATALAPQLLRWWRSATVIAAGGVVAVLAAIAVALLAADPATPLSLLLVPVSLVALGIAPVFALGATLVLTHAPTEQTGSAQAVQEVSGGLGNTVGLALGGTLALATYGAAFGESAPTAAGHGAINRGRESVGTALADAEAQPGFLGEQLRQAATEAFAAATGSAYVMAAVGFAIVATLALTLLAGDRTRARGDGPPDR